MHYIVYQTTNLLNDKVYRGIHQTKNLDDGYLGSGTHLKHAVKKYGRENFNKEILYRFDTEQDMLLKEAELVDEDWCGLSNTYNICVGGFGGGFKYINSSNLKNEYVRKGYDSSIGKFSKEKLRELGIKGALAKKEKGIKHIPSSNFVYSQLGKTQSDEIKRKISEAQQKVDRNGQKNPAFGTMWITDGTRNRKINKLDQIPEGWYKGRKFSGLRIKEL